MIKSGERKDAKLARPVPLYWVYVTAWATPDGIAQFREDIYSRDSAGAVAATSRIIARRGFARTQRATMAGDDRKVGPREVFSNSPGSDRP